MIRSARSRHVCDVRSGKHCTGWIEPGTRYERLVLYPDARADVDRITVLRTCRACLDMLHPEDDAWHRQERDALDAMDRRLSP